LTDAIREHGSTCEANFKSVRFAHVVLEKRHG
jgi:hypothetical protein